MENSSVVRKVEYNYFFDADKDKTDFLLECGKNELAIQEQSRLAIRSRCQTLALLLVSGVSASIMLPISNNGMLLFSLLPLPVCWGVLLVFLMYFIWSRPRTTAWGAPIDNYVLDETTLERKHRKLYAINNIICERQEENKKMGNAFNATLVLSITSAAGFILFHFWDCMVLSV